METQGFPRETDWSGDDHKAARQEAAPYQIEFRVLVVVRSLDLQGTILRGKYIDMEPMDRKANSSTTARGFSGIDLTVVVAFLAIGFALLLPALRRSHNYSGTLVGGSNMKRLTAAWYLYAIDSAERLVPNVANPNAGLLNTLPSWVAGYLSVSAQNSHNTNTSYLVNPYGLRGDYSSSFGTNGVTYVRGQGGAIRHYGGLLGSYESDPALFRNPNDPSGVVLNGILTPRARSISMNLMLGDSKTLDSFASGNQTAGYQVKRRLSQFGRQSPASTFVMIEEHPDSINDGALVTELSNQNTIYDWPANFSNRGFWISFADGRVELWKFSGTHFQRAFSGTTVSTSGLSQNETNSFRRLLDVTAVK